MKTAISLVLLVLPAFAADAPSKADKEVSAVVETWRQAIVKGDAATLNKLYASELVYEHSSAKNETKTESIENATKADGIPQSVQFHNPSIHVYGNTATFKSVGDFTNHAGAVSHLDVLMVWVKSGSGWQLVARQSTKIQ